MTFWEILLLVRRRWLLILATLVIGLIGAAASTATITPQYAAVARLYVTSTGAQDPASLAQATTYMRQQIKSYPGIVTSPLVLRPAIDELDLDVSTAALASRVSASVPMDTTWVDISVQDQDAERAADIATAIGEQFIVVVTELETRPGAAESPVRVTLVDQPEAPTQPVSPHLRNNLLLGGVGGLVLGLLLAVLVHAPAAAADAHRAEQRPAVRTDDPLAGVSR